MHTKTSKEVLAPLAECVSSLMLIIANAEINKSPTPNLVQLSQAVANQVQRLLDVSAKILQQNGSDDRLKTDMAPACKELTQASSLIVSASLELAKDPMSSESRSKLLESVKGILGGTTNVLSAFDDFEVRKITTAINLVTDMISTAKPSNPQFIQQISTITQLIVSIGQGATKRCKEMLFGAHDLEQAIQQLVKTSPTFVTACKLALKNQEKEYQDNLEKSGSILCSICLRIETLVTQTTPIKAVRSTNELARDLLSDQTTNYQEFLDHCSKKLERFMEQADTLQSPKLAKKTIDDIESFLGNLKEKISENDLVQAKAIVRAIDSSFYVLESQLNRELVGDILETSQKLFDLTKKGISTETDLEEFVQAQNILEEHLLNAVSTTNSPELDNLRNILSEQGNILKGAAKLLISNPDDALVKEYYKTVCERYVDTLESISSLVTQETVFQAPDIYYGLEHSFEHQAANLKQALEAGKLNEAQNLCKSTENAAKTFLSLVSKEKEHAEDSQFKASIQSQVDKANAALPKVLKTASALIDANFKPTSENIKEFSELMGTVTTAFKDVTDNIVSYKGFDVEEPTVPPVKVGPATTTSVTDSVLDLATEFLADPVNYKLVDKSLNRGEDIQLKTLTFAVKEAVVVNAQAPQRLDLNERLANPLKAVGHDLHVEASYWNSEGNSIIQALQALSNDFILLSKHHISLMASDHDAALKKAFIDDSQHIINDALNVVKAAKPILESCLDKRLRKSLQGTLDKITTLTTQFKIVSSVKASAPNDTDADDQLIACGRNLMEAVKCALRECIGCSLRKDADALYKFKKVVYVSDLLALGIDLKK